MPMNTNAGGRDPGWYDQGEMTLNVNKEKDDSGTGCQIEQWLWTPTLRKETTQDAWKGMCLMALDIEIKASDGSERLNEDKRWLRTLKRK